MRPSRPLKRRGRTPRLFAETGSCAKTGSKEWQPLKRRKTKCLLGHDARRTPARQQATDIPPFAVRDERPFFLRSRQALFPPHAFSARSAAFCEVSQFSTLFPMPKERVLFVSRGAKGACSGGFKRAGRVFAPFFFRPKERALAASMLNQPTKFA